MELRRTLRELMRVRLAKFAALVLGVTIIVAICAPWLAPYDPVKTKPWDSLHHRRASTGWARTDSGATS